MMREKILGLMLLLIISMLGFCQTGPGGVGSNDGTSSLRLWYEANNESYNNGDLIGSVADLSGYGNTITASGNDRPTFVTNSVNGLSSMLFDGNDELFTTYSGNSNENMSFGLVFNYSPTTGNDVLVQHGGRNTMSMSGSDRFFDYIGGSNHTSSSSSTNTWVIHDKTISNSGTNRLKYYVNNSNTDNFNHNIENRTSNTWIGGNGTGGGTGFDGNIGEVYKFTRVLTGTELIIIDNYLSAKYNIPLTTNDLYTADDNGDYDYDVAGIGSDATGTSPHTDSQGTGIVRILNPTGLVQNNFYFWGHDNGALNSTGVTDLPSGESIQRRISRVWRGTKTGGNALSFDVRFDLSSVPGAKTVSDLRLLIDINNDGLFNDETVAGGGIVAGATLISGDIFQFSNVTALTGDRRFTIGSINSTQTPLPIELLSFEAFLNKDLVNLNWVTSTEVNNDYFTVERSIDGNEWEEIVITNGAGNSHQLLEYFENDFSPINGLSYYRLKQTDFNGDYTYSNVLPVRYISERNATLSIFPNPISIGSELNLSFEGVNNEEVLVVIRDIAGREFFSKMHVSVVDGTLVGLPIQTSIPSGVYIITATSENIIYSQRLIIK